MVQFSALATDFAGLLKLAKAGKIDEAAEIAGDDLRAVVGDNARALI